MPNNTSTRLFETEPDLMRFLAPEDREAAVGTRVPVLDLEPGELDLRHELAERRAFAAFVIDGLLLRSIRLGEHGGLCLAGPGDVLSLSAAFPSALVQEAGTRASTPLRLALLGRETLLACRRWPWLVAGLNAKAAESSERVVTQLMICQLPRVDDRVLAILWLLAETWGQVTPSGTVLPMELTHSTLGGLIGARRPTVTLALGELGERGALLRQPTGWLLLERPAAAPAAGPVSGGDPRVVPLKPTAWSGVLPAVESLPLAAPADPATRVDLRRRVARLRAEQESRTSEMRLRLSELVASREAISARRVQRAEPAPPPRPSAPSSG